MCQMCMKITNFDLLAPASSQDKSLMDIAITIKMLTPFQLHQLNIVRMNLKEIFLSDIVCEASNAAKACFFTEDPYVTTANSYT